MSAKLGRDLLLQIDEGSGFTTVAGLRTKSIRLNSQTVDITDSGSGGWTELLPEAGLRSFTVTGSGVFRNAVSDQTIRAAFFAQSELTARLILPDFGTLTGPVLVTALTYGGTHKGEAVFDLTLNASGAISFAPA
jgi:TP901-1 family phage major tail protein